MSRLRATSKKWLIKSLRGLCRVYFRPGWVEHGRCPVEMPTGIYIANYASWIDPLLLMLLLHKEFGESEPDFVVAVKIRHKNLWWSKLAERLGNVLHYDPVK